MYELEIPFKGRKLPGYLYLPLFWALSPPAIKSPLSLLLIMGPTVLSEEIYFMAPAAALELGYAAANFVRRARSGTHTVP